MKKNKPVTPADSRQDKLARVIEVLENEVDETLDPVVNQAVSDTLGWLRKVQMIPMVRSVPEASELAKKAQKQLPIVMRRVTALSGKHKEDAVKLASAIKDAIE
ncbi:MAG: hypothetical protein Q8T11_13730 [Elusimicrobiota bacterium]|nr:hypothetical protein [Elusimicrobiota bacterium]